MAKEIIEAPWSKGALFYAGWYSMQIEFTLARHPQAAGDGQQYVNDFLSGLRPEIVTEMQADADSLFRPRTAKLVKNYQEEWDGTE